MFERILSAVGLPLPDQFDWAAAGIAGGAIAAAILAGWLLGRWLGPRLAHLWTKVAGGRVENLAPRICAATQYIAIWLILRLALEVYAWPPLASLLLGFVAAIAAGVALAGLARGLGAARLIAWLLGVLAFVGVLADAVGGLDPMSSALDGVAVTIGSRRWSLLNILQIAVGLAMIYLVVRLANRMIGHSLKANKSLEPAQRVLAEKLFGIAILIIAFFVGLGVVGIDLTALAVFGGAFGLAVGFGLQKTIGNLFAGIILLMDRSIKPGDVIVVGDTYGQVTKIGVRAVSVVTRDGKEHLIPNEDLMTREVENWSYSSKDVRVHIPVGVGYDSDLQLAQRLMIEAAQESNRVLKVPKPNVWLRGYGDNAVEHEILVWISDPEAGVGNVQSEILNRLWLLFKEHGIEVPFPQRDVHIKEWPGRNGPPEPASRASAAE